MIIRTNNKVKNNKRKAILSVDNGIDYAFYSPIVSYYWTKMGFEPILLIADDYKNWDSGVKQVVFKANLQIGTSFCFLNIDSINSYFKTLQNSSIAQISRIFGFALPFIDEDDYVATGDVDMIPFDKRTFEDIDKNKKFNIHFSNGYNHERYCMCYVIATKIEWEKLICKDKKYININDCMIQTLKRQMSRKFLIDKKAQWHFDEIFLHFQISRHPQYPDCCNMIEREIVLNSSSAAGSTGVPYFLPKDRLDRSYWHCRDIDQFCDIHCKRNGYEIDKWKDIEKILASSLNENEVKFFKNYYDKFIKMKKEIGE